MKPKEFVLNVCPNAFIERVIGHAWSVKNEGKEIGLAGSAAGAWYHAALTIKKDAKNG